MKYRLNDGLLDTGTLHPSEVQKEEQMPRSTPDLP